MQKLYWCFLVVENAHVSVDTYPTVLKNLNGKKHKDKWNLVSNEPLPIWCSDHYKYSFVMLCDEDLMKDEMELMPDALLNRILDVVKSYHPVLPDNIFKDLNEVIAHIEEHMNCC